MRKWLLAIIPLLIALSPLVFAGLITIENDVIIAGRLGINTYYPQYPLEVHGNAYIAGYLNAHELRENGVPLENIYAKIAWIQENFYTKSKVDQLILGNRSEIESWISTNFAPMHHTHDDRYYTKNQVDQYIIGNRTEIENWVIANYYNKNKVDELILGNVSELKAWIGVSYYDKDKVDQLIIGNFTELQNWVKINYYNASKVDKLILGNKTEVMNWVQANYYTKNEIDSWNLIKNYVLQNNLNANGFNITNVGYIGIGTSNPRALLHVVTPPTNRYMIIIRNPNGYDLVDYQVRIDVSMVVFQNFKIVDSNGNELPYCFEQPNGECNESRSNMIWVKIPNIPANGEVILYIENTDKNHAVRGDQVFDFYDDFSLGVVDVDKWERYDDNYFVVRDGKLVVRDGTAFRYIVSKRGFTPPIIVEARIRFVEGMDADGSIAILNGSNGNWHRGYTHAVAGLAGSGKYSIVYFTPIQGISNVCSFSGTGTEMHVAGYVVRSTNEIEAFTYAPGTRQSCTISTSDFKNVYVAIVDDAWHDGAYQNKIGNQAIIDWIRVRKYADDEPIVEVRKEPVALIEGRMNIVGTLTISDRNGEVKAEINDSGNIVGYQVYSDYFRLTKNYCWGSVTNACSGWEISYYPEGTMVFRYTNDYGTTYREVMKLWPFGVATPFAIDKSFLERVDSISMYLVSVDPSSTSAIIDLTWTGTVIVTIYSENWEYIDSITIIVDGVSKTMPFSSQTYKGAISLIFTVGSSLRIELHNTDTNHYAYFNVMIIKIAP